METTAHLAAVREGDVLAGKYRVEQVLGSGGMGVVVSAHHLQLRQRVAVKFLLPHACANTQAVTRFLREARAAVQIQSEHVARVIDVGTLETGAPYMVMELLRGLDLAQLLETHGPLPVAQAVGYLLQACEAVAEAHALGIVHRDLKPRNLFLTHRADGSPLVKVLDFGISKSHTDMLDATSAALTNTGAVLGSPLYMSPEQIRNARTVDARTDIWSLGVILFELLTGNPIFMADTLSGLLAAIVADEPRSVRTMSGVPPSVARAIGRCLEKDVARRYQSVADLAVELAPYASPEDQMSATRTARIARGSSHDGDSLGCAASNQPATSNMPTSPGGAWTASRATPAPSWRRKALLAGGGGLLVVGVCAIVIGILVRHPQAESETGVSTKAGASSILAAERTPSDMALDTTGNRPTASSAKEGNITVIPALSESAQPIVPSSDGGLATDIDSHPRDIANGARMPRSQAPIVPSGVHKTSNPRPVTSNARQHRDRGSELFGDME